MGASDPSAGRPPWALGRRMPTQTAGVPPARAWLPSGGGWRPWEGSSGAGRGCALAGGWAEQQAYPSSWPRAPKGWSRRASAVLERRLAGCTRRSAVREASLGLRLPPSCAPSRPLSQCPWLVPPQAQAQTLSTLG
eukprot:8169161-Alexandrium_andersonii.AAC.1